MNTAVTGNAKSDQIFQGIISERAAKAEMMNLQLACTTRNFGISSYRVLSLGDKAD